MRTSLQGRQRGVSLIEAVVALAVMAFGMLAVVGLQSSLRLSADVAKQRSEAVRIAQETMEDWRAFTTVPVTAGHAAYADVADLGPVAVAGYTTNTSFTLTGMVTDRAGYKLLRVAVAWVDRAGENQTVELNSSLSASPPAIAATLGIPSSGDPDARPQGRHRSIPVEATDIGQGDSGFIPQSGGTVAWVFNNTTGIITSICTVSVTATNASLVRSDLSSCADVTAQLVMGTVRFASTAAQPGAAEAESPTGPALNLDVLLTASSGGSPLTTECFDDAPSVFSTGRTAANYFCAVVLPDASSTWSGMSTIVPLANDTPFIWAIDTTGSFNRRVCRYTPATSDGQAIKNREHPRHYVDVPASEALTQQNFLLVAAVHSCPTDVAADPANGDFVNANTLQHQPAP